MNLAARALVLAIGVWTATAIRAECSVSADDHATVRTVSPTVEADAELIISMSIVPKVMHFDYKTAAQRPACDLGPLAAGRTAYELWGGDTGGRERRALPRTSGQPIAVMLPIFDIKKAVASAGTGKPASTEGYLLAIVTKDDLTGWRFYTAMPDAMTLKHDMADALAGVGHPIFRNGAGGQTMLYTPKS